MLVIIAVGGSAASRHAHRGPHVGAHAGAGIGTVLPGASSSTDRFLSTSQYCVCASSSVPLLTRCFCGLSSPTCIGRAAVQSDCAPDASLTNTYERVLPHAHTLPNLDLFGWCPTTTQMNQHSGQSQFLPPSEAATAVASVQDGADADMAEPMVPLMLHGLWQYAYDRVAQRTFFYHKVRCCRCCQRGSVARWLCWLVGWLARRGCC